MTNSTPTKPRSALRKGAAALLVAGLLGGVAMTPGLAQAAPYHAYNHGGYYHHGYANHWHAHAYVAPRYGYGYGYSYGYPYGYYAPPPVVYGPPAGLSFSFGF